MSTILANEFSVLGQSNARTQSITRGQSFISLSLPNVCHRSGTISPLFTCSLLWNSLPSSLRHPDVDFSRFRNALATYMGFPVHVSRHTKPVGFPIKNINQSSYFHLLVPFINFWIKRIGTFVLLKKVLKLILYENFVSLSVPWISTSFCFEALQTFKVTNFRIQYEFCFWERKKLTSKSQSSNTLDLAINHLGKLSIHVFQFFSSLVVLLFLLLLWFTLYYLIVGTLEKTICLLEILL